MRQKLNLVGIGAITTFITYKSTTKLTAAPGQDIGLSMLMLHGIAYFGLAAALLVYLHDTERGHLEAILIAAVAGLGIELIQMQLPYRFFSVTDILANTAGASLILLDYNAIVTSRIVRFEDRVLESSARVGKHFLTLAGVTT